MSGLEIEHLALAARISYAASENFSALEPADKYQIVGIGNIEMFAVHFLVGNFNMFGKTGGYRVCGRGNSKSLPLVYFSPFKGAARAHKPSERLGHVCGVKKYATHAAQNALADFFNKFV